MSDSLGERIRQELNKASRENESNTPDHLLAAYLMSCLEAGENLIVSRDQWYGHKRAAPQEPEGVVEVGDVISHQPRNTDLFFRFKKLSMTSFGFVDALSLDNAPVFRVARRILVSVVPEGTIVFCSDHGWLTGSFKNAEQGFDAVAMHLLRDHWER